MGKYGVLSSNLLGICILVMSILSNASDEDRKVHIVYMGALPDGEYSPTSHHLSILQTVVADSVASNSLILSYKRSFNGFAANLTDQEGQKLASLKEVVSVFPSKTFHTQTTRSWDFMGLRESISRNPAMESDVIIGVIDTGIWPESESFSDKGFGPPPKKWKGGCKGGVNFTCNNKIIGARFYQSIYLGVKSARDEIGHGTHTASTAAGNSVKDASFYGIAEGTTRGGVPSARIAAYKVCSPRCESYSILASIDDAIADGVDIITISIGHGSAAPFDNDPVAIGSFHAMAKGVLVVNSAGNNGPMPATVTSLVPWLMTVAASSIDRRITDKVVLGNGVTMIVKSQTQQYNLLYFFAVRGFVNALEVQGNSVNSFTLNGTSFPLIYGKNASMQCSDWQARRCDPGCLDSGLVKGKIVVCNVNGGADEAYRAGALGSIISMSDPEDVSFILPLPASVLNKTDFEAVMAYLNSTDHPEATILRSESSKDFTAPVTASFSSRGPNIITQDILKPDISAPGIDILAAFPPTCSPSDSLDDKRRVKYTILSGTSMSCPHVAGAAAYVKTFHPDWSPSAVKSALMTTAGVMKKRSLSFEGFDYGSGHLNPVKAVNPGLVYDAGKDDYVRFLCSVGYTKQRVRLISGDKSSCPAEGSDKGSPRDLNYPSMTALVMLEEAFTIRFRRRVRNVGSVNSTYSARVVVKPAIDVKVVPSVLSFESLNEEKSFDVIVSGNLSLSNHVVSAPLVWSDGTHEVRSPIVLHSA